MPLNIKTGQNSMLTARLNLEAIQTQNAFSIPRLLAFLQLPVTTKEKIQKISLLIFHLQSAAALDRSDNEEVENYTKIAAAHITPALECFFIQAIQTMIRGAQTSSSEQKDKTNIDVIAEIDKLFKQLKYLQSLTVPTANPVLASFVENQLMRAAAPLATSRDKAQLNLLNPDNVERFNHSLTNATFSRVFETFYACETNTCSTLDEWDRFFNQLMSLQEIIPLQYILMPAAGKNKNQHLADLRGLIKCRESAAYTDPLLKKFFTVAIQKTLPLLSGEQKSESNIDVIDKINKLYALLEHLQTLIAPTANINLANFAKNQLTRVTAPSATKRDLIQIGHLNPSYIEKFNAFLINPNFSSVFEAFYETEECQTLEEWVSLFNQLMLLQDILPIQRVLTPDAGKGKKQHLSDLQKLIEYVRAFNENSDVQSPGNSKNEFMSMINSAIKLHAETFPLEEILKLMAQIKTCLENEIYFQDPLFRAFFMDDSLSARPLTYFIEVLPLFLHVCHAKQKYRILPTEKETIATTPGGESKGEATSGSKREREKTSSTDTDSSVKRARSASATATTPSYDSLPASSILSIAMQPTSPASSSSSSIIIDLTSPPRSPTPTAPTPSSSSSNSESKTASSPNKRADRISIKIFIPKAAKQRSYSFSKDFEALFDHFIKNIFNPELLNLPDDNSTKITLLEESKALYHKLNAAEKICFIETLIEPGPTFERERTCRELTSENILDYFEFIIKDSVNRPIFTDISGATLSTDCLPCRVFYPLIGAINISNKTRCEEVLDRLQRCGANPHETYFMPRDGNHPTIIEYVRTEPAISHLRGTPTGHGRLPQHHPHALPLLEKYAENFKAKTARPASRASASPWATFSTKPVAGASNLSTAAAPSSSPRSNLPTTPTRR
jgi:hypothetical protein